MPTGAKPRWATTAQVCEAAGISGPTAFRWSQKGVLPPYQKVHGGQRGLSARWPLHAPEQARWVKGLLDEGLTFDEIRDAIERGDFRAGRSEPEGGPVR